MTQPATPQHRSRIHHRRGGGAFTITELMLVIGIIVLVAIIALPAFRAMTGSRSSESAINQMSAVLARARTEALGLQQPRGILFYKDLSTGRVAMAMVYGVVNPLDSSWSLDLAPDHDVVLLPVGVGIQFIDNQLTAADDKFIGFNTRIDPASATGATTVPFGQVILFDANGQVAADTYRFRIHYPAIPRASDLGKLLYDDPVLAAAPSAGSPELVPEQAKAPFTAAVGFVLFDYDAFSSANGGRTVATSADSDNQIAGTSGNGPFAEEQTEENWLDANGTPVLVNRYNGTLVRSE